jgi:hypothetical protein
MGIIGHMNITSARRAHQAIKRIFEKVVDGFAVIQELTVSGWKRGSFHADQGSSRMSTDPPQGAPQFSPYFQGLVDCQHLRYWQYCG